MKNKKFITFLTALVFTLSAIFIILSAGSKNCYAADPQVLASWETTIDEATGQYTSIKAKWNKVWAGSGYVSMYIVALYKDGTMVAQTTVSDPVYDVSQVILKEGGKGSGTYKVEVLPVAAGMNTFITDNLVLNMHSLTISLMGQGDDIVVRNIQDRTKVAKVLKSAYISKLPANTSTQNYYIHSGKALIGFSILPWYTYDNMDELAEKSVYLFPGGDTNLTDRLVLDGDGYIYANWFNIINNVELTVTTPDCGTATNTPKKSGSWQWDQQTNAPVTAIPSGVKYYQDTSGGALSAWWVTASDSDVPYVGTLKGDESYSLQADLTAEYGYIFPYSDALGNMSITVNGATLSDYYAADEDYGHTVLSIIGNVKPKHLEQTVAGKDPSCTATGLTEGKKCSACGDILAAQNEIAALGHKWTAGAVKKATLEEDGEMTGVTCSRCSAHGEDIAIARPAAFDLPASYTYTGSAIIPSVSVKDADGKAIPAENYDIVCSNHTNVGTAKAMVVFKGDYYEGSKELSYKITSKNTTPAIKLSSESFTYDGKEKTPTVKVLDGSKELTKDTDYTLTFASGRINAGSYNVDVSLKGNYTGSASKTFTITKAANPIKVKGKLASVKYGKVKKKSQTIKRAKAVKVSGAQGTLTYTLGSVTKAKFKKYFKVNKKTGNITVKKGLKKGTYKVKIKVKAAGNANYSASAVKTVTCTVKVK